MKSILKIFSIILLVVSVSLPGCKWPEKEEPAPTPPPSVIYEAIPNGAPGEGYLYVYIFGGPRFAPVGGAQVGLYVKPEDITNNLPLLSTVSDSNGKVDFGPLNLANYYVYVRKRENNNDYQKTELAQIQSAKTLTRNIILY